ncbi:putative beta-lysine N-acetyltransferase [Lederbergia citrea]|uniref:Beta-lysine N-acetyltransferase n=1 Tax=Lederbergia citrea TaxID=2833581 RepID=A0A942UNH1_9BACI|nr:putative beta-lysine N-acetyltransferase [Lederbergia citrea]MBS4222116.1 putative beta-lysine N-acetyltransferase [Lederbergia citrea]
MTQEMIRLKRRHFHAYYWEDHLNKRLRIDDYLGDIKKMEAEIWAIAKNINAEKIIIKCRQKDICLLLGLGYILEGWIDHYFHGDDAVFMVKYLHSERKENENWNKEEEILNEVLQSKSKKTVRTKYAKARKASYSDCERLANLYKKTFKVYPVPIHNPFFIKEEMEGGTIYYYIEENGEIISAASAEINNKYKNAELTDCATMPEYRKDGLMKVLLSELEKELCNEGVFTSYSLARALSYGMNKAFFQLDYQYRGRLTKNCYIYDKLESMNVWVKDLSFQ